MKSKRIVPLNMWVPLTMAILCNSLAYYGTRIVMGSRYHYNLSNWLNDQIPCIPWTIVIYLGCYIYWIINYIIGCRQEPKTAFRFMSADFSAKIICMICFLLFPTTNDRPHIEGTAIWDIMMRWLYQTDAADNLFPSIHCLTSWFCFIAVRKNKRIPVWYKCMSIFMTLAVCVSTLTTKQHVLIDAAFGILLAEGSYLFVCKCGFSMKYTKYMSKINKLLFERGKLLE